MTDVLTEKQRAVADAFLAERERDRKHLVMYLSGAHAYGFPSPDSDLDLKCVHVAPTRRLVGLSPPSDPPDRIVIIDGVEVDYGSNELGPVLDGCLKGNGNYLERIFGALVMGGNRELLAEAREVVRPTFSRRCMRHYRGFATSQLKSFEEKPTAKRALYVLRTAASGRHLLMRGEVETDVANMRDFVPPEIDELLEIKRRGEQSQLSSERAELWKGRLRSAVAAVDTDGSPLPVEPSETAVEAVDGWLVDVRRRFW